MPRPRQPDETCILCKHRNDERGECRKEFPQANRHGDGIWPHVERGGWCDDWEGDEDAVQFSEVLGSMFPGP